MLDGKIRRKASFNIETLSALLSEAMMCATPSNAGSGPSTSLCDMHNSVPTLHELNWHECRIKGRGICLPFTPHKIDGRSVTLQPPHGACCFQSLLSSTCMHACLQNKDLTRNISAQCVVHSFLAPASHQCSRILGSEGKLTASHAHGTVHWVAACASSYQLPCCPLLL